MHRGSTLAPCWHRVGTVIGGDTRRMSGRCANEGGVIWHVHTRGSKPVNLATLAASTRANRGPVDCPVPRGGCAASVRGDDGNGHPPMVGHSCQLAAHPADLSRQTWVFGHCCNRVLSDDQA